MQIRPMRFRALSLFVLLFLIILGTRAQNQTNNYGKEFRFAFLDNYGSLEKVSFVFSSESAHYNIQLICGSINNAFTIYGKDTIIDYLKFGTPSSTQFSGNRSVYITSTKPVTLVAMNNSLNSTDISAIIPSERVPSNPVYFVNTYRGDESIGKPNNSLFSVVAIDDSVLVTILPTCDSKFNLVKGQIYKKWLRVGQVYQEQAMDSQSFAGTKIWNSKGCKRFVVFEGAKCSFVEYNNVTCKGCDHLYGQTRPMQYLGRSFTTVPFTGNTGGYVYQIVATENGTQVSLNGIPTVTLNEGEPYLVNQKSNVPVCITSSKAISVIELMKSGECNGQSINLGNPSLMSLIPDEQTTTSAGFSFPFTSNISLNPSFPAEYYVAIVAKPGHLGDIRLNGIQLDTVKFSSTCNMAVASFKLNGQSKNHISSTYGVVAYMYAYGKDESYASEIASGFESQVTQIVLESNKTSICDTTHKFTFKANSDSAANYYWSFGDGSFASGDSVLKSYNRAGKFKLKLNVNYTGTTGCTKDSLEKEINVYSQPVFSLGKDTQLCQGVYFELSPIVRPKSSLRWWNGSTSSLVVISNNAKAWLTITDTNKCQYTDSIQIRFINCDTSSIVIPNVFTPGSVSGDNINDLFETQYSGFDQLQGYIFNRWGVRVYEFSHPNNGYWNGCHDNNLSNPCPSGTYYYVYKFTNSNTGLVKEVNGVVELIR